MDQVDSSTLIGHRSYHVNMAEKGTPSRSGRPSAIAVSLVSSHSASRDLSGDHYQDSEISQFSLNTPLADVEEANMSVILCTGAWNLELPAFFQSLS
jgi:hypothetical protein